MNIQHRRWWSKIRVYTKNTSEKLPPSQKYESQIVLYNTLGCYRINGMLRVYHHFVMERQRKVLCIPHTLTLVSRFRCFIFVIINEMKPMHSWSCFRVPFYCPPQVIYTSVCHYNILDFCLKATFLKFVALQKERKNDR